MPGPWEYYCSECGAPAVVGEGPEDAAYCATHPSAVIAMAQPASPAARYAASIRDPVAQAYAAALLAWLTTARARRPPAPEALPVARAARIETRLRALLPVDRHG